jgi:hypothetical protein
LKSKYDPWKNNAGVFILILLSYPLGIAEKWKKNVVNALIRIMHLENEAFLK